MKRYNPAEIEPKWQKVWADEQTYKAVDFDTRPKYYALSFFPYPSGAGLHIGHTFNFAITDVAARAKRMQGYNVMQPMGWDSFGLPGENYAIKTGVAPQISTKKNTDNFREQCKRLGLAIDWTREFSSSDPGYYRWTQWFFLLLLERGLAYQQESPQWWCETDKTVLANEQVEAGRCWRCGNLVVKKNLKQWFFKITDYADRLVADLDDLDWPEGIKTMQRNWIGKSKGARVSFAVDGHDENVEVFTTRPDTLFGATFMVLAPEHPLVDIVTTEEQKVEVVAYVAEAARKNEIERQEEAAKEKTGVFTGAYAVNPVTGKNIPIWTADYVLMGYGTGAIMAVPAHDERDYDFATKFDLPVTQVIAERFMHTSNPILADSPIIERNVVCLVVKHPYDELYLIVKPTSSDFWAPVMGGIDEGEDVKSAAKRELLEESGFRDIENIQVFNQVIASEFYAQHKQENRVAYCNTVLVELASLEADEISAEEQSMQELKWATKAEVATLCVGAGAREIYALADGGEPTMPFEGRLINSGKYDGMLSSEAREKIVADLEQFKQGSEQVNYKIRDWLISRQRYWGAPIPVVHCPKDGVVPVPKDQLPLELPTLEKFQPSGDGQSPLALATDWVNTTCPTCGGAAKRETDTMDGFACSSWYFLRFADPKNDNEPFAKDKVEYWAPVDMYVGGAEHAVMHLLYARMWTKVMQDAGIISFGEPFKALRNQGMLLAADGEKISKSKGNGIKPEEIIEQGYGADALRMIVLFLAPFDKSTPWSNEGLAGVFRFLQRVWTINQNFIASEVGDNTEAEGELFSASHKAIKKVSQDIEHMAYNTAISALMQLTNELYVIEKNYGFAAKNAWRFALTTLIQLLAPFAPHITEELWNDLSQEGSVHVSKWPIHDQAYLLEHVLKIAVQVNGKLRGEIEIPHDAPQDVIVAEASTQENVAQYLSDGIKKTIYVPGKIVNFVV